MAMKWLEEVTERIARKNQILFAKNSVYLQKLIRLIEEQNHRTMVLWALEFAEEIVDKLNMRYPDEARWNEALFQSRKWSQGLVKMPVAQKAILDVHAFAKEINSLEDIALCHAVGQACGTVHSNRHAIGLPIYDLTAIIRKYGVPDCKEPVEKRMEQYITRVQYWQENYLNYTGRWAAFMLKGE